ncbi:hypothetical protein BGZ94_002227 [Podila epigama]|nr:hypothetical protein BGZ94_002227 [Podila epigama]
MPVHELPRVRSVLGQGPPVGTLLRSFLLTDPQSPDNQTKDNNNDVKPGESIKGIRDVVLGFDDLTAYRQRDDPYFGATVGRVANRIADGKFSLPGNPDIVYQLDQNNGPNALHGGKDGFSSRNWSVDATVSDPETDQGVHDNTTSSIRFSLVSDHLDQGYPGRLVVSCTYALIDYSLQVTHEAHLDSSSSNSATTIVNLTNHSYFNLDGVPASSTSSDDLIIIEHELELVNAHAYLELNDTSIPTGKLELLQDNPIMDFRLPKPIGEHLRLTPNGGIGYDHFFITKDAYTAPERYHMQQLTPRSEPFVHAKVYSPTSGIELTMSTTDPGFQFYTANYVQLDRHQVDMTMSSSSSSSSSPGHQTRYVGKAYNGYKPYAGFCLEASRFPDAIHHTPWQDQVILRQGDQYHSMTIFSFRIR